MTSCLPLLHSDYHRTSVQRCAAGSSRRQQHQYAWKLATPSSRHTVPPGQLMTIRQCSIIESYSVSDCWKITEKSACHHEWHVCLSDDLLAFMCLLMWQYNNNRNPSCHASGAPSLGVKSRYLISVDTVCSQCSGNPAGAITHSNINEKGNTTVYTWIPPDSQSPIYFMYVWQTCFSITNVKAENLANMELLHNQMHIYYCCIDITHTHLWQVNRSSNKSKKKKEKSKYRL